MFLIILLNKVLYFCGKLIGKGSSLPGKIALKCYPNILQKLIYPKYIIAVTGSNGKTSSCEMLSSVIKSSGLYVISNKEGSNQTEGVATMLLNNCNFRGKIKADVIVLETDERYARHTFKHFKPTHYIINNLYPDQLTRNGHPEWTYNIIKQSIYPKTRLILNADDTLVSLFGHGRDNCVYFSMKAIPKNHLFNINSFKNCPLCKEKMESSYINHDFSEKFVCTKCDFKNSNPTYSITDIGENNSYIIIDDNIKINLTLKSLYNAYNILAVYSMCCEIGIEPDIISAHLNNYIIKNDRIKSFTINEKNVILYTSKHENSTSYNQSIDMTCASTENIDVMIYVDKISRKYYTSETSWLWDINFEKLSQCTNIKNIILCGNYATDLAVRFKKIPNTKIFIDFDDAIKFFKDNETKQLIVITCFSDRDKVVKL